MADNDKAMKKIATLILNLKMNELEFVDFVEEFEKVCFNDISSRNLDYFADGWSKGTVSTFMKVCLKAFDGDDVAVMRLHSDLDLKEPL